MDFAGLLGQMAGLPAHSGRAAAFESGFRCYSMMMLPGRSREDANKGGKVIMPASALEKLTRRNISYPMLFSIQSKRSGRITHCGVLEFIADEGLLHMPHWMMQNMAITEGEHIVVKNVEIPVATFAKFQPQSVDFLDISDPKAVLENELRQFSCLTEDDVIAIKYNGKTYEIKVMEVKPKHMSKAVSIVECDLELDFAAPVGYVEPERVYRQPVSKTSAIEEAAARVAEEDAKVAEEEKKTVDAEVFQSYCGVGNRLDGKASKQTEILPVASGGPTSEAAKLDALRRARAAAAEARFKPGRLSFAKNTVAATTPRPASAASSQAGGKATGAADTEEAKPKFEAFGGKGNTLR